MQRALVGRSLSYAQGVLIAGVAHTKGGCGRPRADAGSESGVLRVYRADLSWVNAFGTDQCLLA
jgi:hypothetical protein